MQVTSFGSGHVVAWPEPFQGSRDDRCKFGRTPKVV
jgi:hypothetical protein